MSGKIATYNSYDALGSGLTKELIISNNKYF